MEEVIKVFETNNKFYLTKEEAEKNSSKIEEKIALKVGNKFYLLEQEEPILIEPWKQAVFDFYQKLMGDIPTHHFGHYKLSFLSKKDQLDQLNQDIEVFKADWEIKHINQHLKKDLDFLRKILSS